MSDPLSGIVVLDLTHVLAGPFSAMTLGDLGAHVIKVERPATGDDTRAFPPFVGKDSAYFAALNRGIQGSRNTGVPMTYGEAYQRLFPTVEFELG